MLYPFILVTGRYLRFMFRGQLYQFNVLPNGLSSAPRDFTRLMKVLFGHLREQGHVSVGYIDDSWLMGLKKTSCLTNVVGSVQTFDRAVFTVHQDKSVLQPTQSIVFVGFVLDSVDMTVSLTREIAQKIIDFIHHIQSADIVIIRDVAKLIGMLVATFPAMQFGKLYYRQLELDKIDALSLAGHYEADMRLSKVAKQDLHWWLENLCSAKNPIEQSKPSIVLTSDASARGWGAVRDKKSSDGRWNKQEQQHHINYLELLAGFLALQTFCKHEDSVHIRMQLDNSTAVSYIQEMGGCHSRACNQLARVIWQWAKERNIWLSASHIPGVHNVVADTESRQFNDNKEWQLDPTLFAKICRKWGMPIVDLFASRINHQVPCYVSWRPDPQAVAIDAFSKDWSAFGSLYLFPPFSLINKTLQNLQWDKWEDIMIVPRWRVQPLYPTSQQMLVDPPMILPVQDSTIRLSHAPGKCHPMGTKLRLMACRLSASIC